MMPGAYIGKTLPPILEGAFYLYWKNLLVDIGRRLSPILETVLAYTERRLSPKYPAKRGLKRNSSAREMEL